jgi:tetratricopeptide (TPR) repeat protein
VTLDLGSLREAQVLFEKAREQRRVLARNAPEGSSAQKDLGSVERLVGNASFEAGDFRAARTACRKSAALLEAVVRVGVKSVPGLPDGPPGLAEVRQELASAYEKLGHCDSKLGEAAAARDDYGKCLKLLRQLSAAKIATPVDHNALAWFLATCPDATMRDPAQAVKSARAAVAAAPMIGVWWTTLGVALHRNGEWKEAITALEKAIGLDRDHELQKTVNYFFLAMCHWRLNHKDEARKWHARALKGIEQFKSPSDELRRFRDEAAALLSKPQ